MKRTKLFILLTSVLLLSSCGDGAVPEVTESVTVSITGETSDVTVTEESKKNFLGDYTEAPETEAVTSAENDTAVYIGGKEYYFTDGELALYDFDGDIESCLDDIKAVSPERITVYDSTPSSYESALLMTEFPDCDIWYNSYDGGQVSHDEGFQFYVNPVVELNDNGEPFWQTRDRYICAGFSNFSDEPMTVTALRIYYCYDETYANNGERKAMPFKNGEYELELNFPLEPHREAVPGADGGYDLTVSEENFDYENALIGRYIAEAVCGDTVRETEFFINGYGGRELPDVPPDDLLFTDAAEALKSAHDEINAAFRETHITKEYAEAHTAEDFRNEFLPHLTYDLALRLLKYYGAADDDGKLLETWCDYPGNIVYAGNIILPVYPLDTAGPVTLKEIMVKYHPDTPYSISYSERNIRLIRTEEGWLADRYPEIYY